MKRFITVFVSLVVLLTLLGCSQSSGTGSETRSRPSNSAAAAADNETRELHSPYSSDGFFGKNCTWVANVLREAGFKRIEFTPIDDIDSQSGIQDGTVESVSIGGSLEFTEKTVFDKESPVMITYHNIPKLSAPVSSSAASEKHYMTVGKLFYDSGFRTVEMEEVYDLPASAEAQTELRADNDPIESGELLPYDSHISVIGHFPSSSFLCKIEIEFEANWIFSKYDVDVFLNGKNLGTLPHGENATLNYYLTPGQYLLSFEKHKDSDISGSVEFTIDSETSAAYHISSHYNRIDVRETAFTKALTDGSVLMPYSSSHYLLKDYQAVFSELMALGFKKVAMSPTTECLWTPPVIGSVVKILIGDASSFDRNALIRKDASITIYYHVTDFAFERGRVEVTEKESFELSYTLTSGDSIDAFSFEIDHPEVLQRNDDGSYTALTPGTATVTVSCSGEVCSSCRVDVAEIVVPIERIEFENEEYDVAVGSVFELDYTIYPENANRKDVKIVTSDSDVLVKENNSFYINEAGDATIEIYQDDRLLGSCIVHAAVVEIEEFFLEETVDNLLIGDTLELTFNVVPENATIKGIVIESSNPEVVTVEYDERGPAAFILSAKAKGAAEITVTVPNGQQFSRSMTVNEINPNAITLTNTNPKRRIEVGTSIQLEAGWDPINTSDQQLSWSSSNNAVIRVSGDGTFEAVGLGTADIVARHKTGVTGTITLTVEPTLVKEINLNMTRDSSKTFVKGDQFKIDVSVSPENATNQSLTFTSNDVSVATVSAQGVVTAVGVGTTSIRITSPDGPSRSISVTVSPAPQRFYITYSAWIVSNNHVGSNWRPATLEVNNEPAYNGVIATVEPGGTLSIRLSIVEEDTNPDVGYYFKKLDYSESLCKNGYTESGSIYVTENNGRYSGSKAEWRFSVTVTPIN